MSHSKSLHTVEIHFICYFDQKNLNNLATITSIHKFIPLVLRVILKLIFHKFFTLIHFKTIVLSNLCFVLLLFTINLKQLLDKTSAPQLTQMFKF